MNLPRVVTVHDLTFIDRPDWHESAKVHFFQRMMRAAVARAAIVIAVSEYTARRTAVVLQPDAPIVTIPHGVDHENFRPGQLGDPTELERLATFGIRPPYVAFTGTHEPRKNLPGLIAAFGAVAPGYPELTLVLSGPPGWGTDEVERAIAASSVAHRIVRPGRLPYQVLPEFFRQAEVVTYPSFNEGFGLPALETLASGGVLLSTTGSAVETIVDDAACLVDPTDGLALGDALDALLRDEGARAALRARGPVVAAPFTWKRSAALHLEAYEQAIGASS
jgi:glycosyltransferase involved in cell wall biosynthesis